VRLSTVLVVAATAVAGMAASACDRDDEPTARPAREFCVAADDLDEGLSAGRLDLDEQIRLVGRLVEHAPSEISADATTFLDALERVDDDPSVRDDPDVEEAVDNVNRYASRACGLFEEGG
jgi:hypothetical protein